MYIQAKNQIILTDTVYMLYKAGKTFEEENFREFHHFVSLSESFLRDCLNARWTVGGTSELSADTTHSPTWMVWSTEKAKAGTLSNLV